MAAEAIEMSEEEKLFGFPKWEVEQDLRSVQSAAEIKGDKKRLLAVRKLAKMQMDALEKVTGGAGGFRELS